MRVFVAGATGVLGRRAVARLVAAGHQVTGVARSPEKGAVLEALGARPVRLDLFDADAVRTAVVGHDAVVNVATKIPPVARMARMSAWDENERIRREASANLVDGAIAAGATVFVQESLAFLYGDHGDDWIDAASTPSESSVFSGAVEAAEGTSHGSARRVVGASCCDSDASTRRTATRRPPRCKRHGTVSCSMSVVATRTRP